MCEFKITAVWISGGGDGGTACRRVGPRVGGTDQRARCYVVAVWLAVKVASRAGGRAGEWGSAERAGEGVKEGNTEYYCAPLAPTNTVCTRRPVGGYTLKV